MKRIFAAFLIGVCTATLAEPKKEISFGGFIDTYLGFDFNEPGGERAFTTQALRHKELGLNLVFLEAKVDKERTRGRLALQSGTSVYANYAGEPRDPSRRTQLSDLLQHVQEAYAGYRLTDGLWIDAGVYFAPYGPESFISKDNWTYTRSLAAEFSPYYQAGVRLSYALNPRWAFALHLLNGWQTITPVNGERALGWQATYSPSESLSITYNGFGGRVGELRIFHDIVVKWQATARWAIAVGSDFGMQRKPGSNAYSLWYVETLLSQYRLSDTVALAGRLEYFHDADGVVAPTGTPHGFQTGGASLNVDWQPDSGVLFRSELRSLKATDAIFPASAGPRNSDLLWVQSLALSF